MEDYICRVCPFVGGKRAKKEGLHLMTPVGVAGVDEWRHRWVSRKDIPSILDSDRDPDGWEHDLARCPCQADVMVVSDEVVREFASPWQLAQIGGGSTLEPIILP